LKGIETEGLELALNAGVGGTKGGLELMTGVGGTKGRRGRKEATQCCPLGGAASRVSLAMESPRELILDGE